MKTQLALILFGSFLISPTPATPAPPPPTRADSISFVPCQLTPGPSTCTSTVQWHSVSSNAKVYVIDPLTGFTQLWAATGTDGNQAWPYTIAWPGQEFEVRVNGVRTARTRVYGRRRPRVALSGGTDYYYYHVDYSTNPLGEWVPYTNLGQLGNSTVHATVQKQLKSLYDAGQRTLRIPVWFLHEGNIAGTEHPYACGAAPDMAGHTLEPLCRNNLATLFHDIHSIGFDHVELGLFPQWHNDPWDCEHRTVADWQALTEENYGVITDLREIAQASDVKYMLDLGNEDIPQTGRALCHFNYARTIWNRYVNQFGTGDTVGFSIALDSTWTAANRYGVIEQIYGTILPPALDLHIYGDGKSNSEAAIFSATITQQNHMSEPVRALPWIIGETYYNDATAASGLAASMTSSSKSVLYVNQWPIIRSTKGSTSAESLTNFSAYQASGF